MIEFAKQEELDKIRSALKKRRDNCLGARSSDLETIKILLDYIDDLHAMLNDPLLPLYLPRELPHHN